MFLVNPIICSTVSSICWFLEIVDPKPTRNQPWFVIRRNNCVSQSATTSHWTKKSEASADEVQRRWGELTRELEIAALSPRDHQGSPDRRNHLERSNLKRFSKVSKVSKVWFREIMRKDEKRTAGCTLQFEHLIFACQTISTPENAVKSHNWSSCCHFHLNPNSHGQSQMYHVSWFIPSLMVN